MVVEVSFESSFPDCSSCQAAGSHKSALHLASTNAWIFIQSDNAELMTKLDMGYQDLPNKRSNVSSTILFVCVSHPILRRHPFHLHSCDTRLLPARRTLTHQRDFIHRRDQRLPVKQQYHEDGLRSSCVSRNDPAALHWRVTRCDRQRPRASVGTPRQFFASPASYEYYLPSCRHTRPLLGASDH